MNGKRLILTAAFLKLVSFFKMGIIIENYKS